MKLKTYKTLYHIAIVAVTVNSCILLSTVTIKSLWDQGYKDHESIRVVEYVTSTIKFSFEAVALVMFPVSVFTLYQTKSKRMKDDGIKSFTVR